MNTKNDLTKVKTVKVDTLYQIADTLGISLKEFFDDPLFDDISDKKNNPEKSRLFCYP